MTAGTAGQTPRADQVHAAAVPAPAAAKPLPDCWYGSKPEATAHTFAAFVQGEPELLLTFCTRCGQIGQDRKP